MSTRGRAGKYTKPKRGGGKHFSRNLKPLDQDDPPGMWDAEPANKSPASDDDDEEEEEGQTVPMTREERKAAEKARKEAAIARKASAAQASDEDDEDEDDDDDDKTLHNPHLTPTNPNAPGNASSGGVSRREREAKEAAAAKERWQKMHLAGKTDEAKADLARLAKIRQEREEKARQRKAELEEKEALAAAKLEASGRRK